MQLYKNMYVVCMSPATKTTVTVDHIVGQFSLQQKIKLTIKKIIIILNLTGFKCYRNRQPLAAITKRKTTSFPGFRE